MKLNKLALLCAVACAGFTGQAMAQLSGNTTANDIVTEANNNGRVLFISGASAVQSGLGQIATSLFQPGTAFSFIPTSAAGRDAADHRVYAGRLARAAGGWAAGSAVIINNRARGGSVWGVNPVARGTAIESLVVSTASCTGGPRTANSFTSDFSCNTLADVVPGAGVSDVAPSLFDDVFNTEGEPSEPKLSAVELATLSAQPIYGLAFGVPMTDNLPLFFVNKALLSGIMTGNFGTWDQVVATEPADDILICRRVNGSGSQAVANLYYGNYPCGASNAPADRDTVPTYDASTKVFLVEGETGGLNVVENSSSGNVRTCMNSAVDASAATFVADGVATPGVFTIDANNRGSFSGTVGYTTYVTADRAGNPVGVALRNGRAHKAIGVLSMDSLPDSTATSKWTFRSILGAGEITYTAAAGGNPAFTTNTGTGLFPDLASYTNGSWDHQGWISFNIPNRTQGNLRSLANNFVAAAKSPAVLAGQRNLAFAAASVPGTPDLTNTGNVLKAGYAGNDQCAPYNAQ